MRDIRLTSWKLSSQPVPGIELRMKLDEKAQTIGQRIQERTINDCFNAGVLLTIREDYTHLKSVPVTLENTWIFSTLENTWIFSKSNKTM